MINEINIDVSNLKEGNYVKNYKELCSMLNQPIYAGTQKKSQLNEFKRFFDYEKIGIKFYIKKIYNEPIPKEHKYPANTKYTEYIEYILLSYLSTKHNGEIYIPSQYLWFKLGMVNYNFIRLQNKDDINELIELDEKMTLFQINNFYRRCRSKLKNITDGALKSFEKQKLINYWRIHMVKYPGKFISEEATIEEEQFILKIEKEILNELGCKDINEVFLKNKYEYYYKERNEKAKELFGASEIYDYYHIIHIPENTKQALSESEVKLKKKELNEKIIKFINDQAEQIYDAEGEESEKIKEFIEEGYWPCDRKFFYYYKGYVEMQHLLSDKLLKID